MFILNKKTKVIQECRNADVIKICKKDVDTYQVAEKLEALEPMAVKETTKESADYDSMNLQELKAVAKARGMEGYSVLSKDELLSVLKGEVV